MPAGIVATAPEEDFRASSSSESPDVFWVERHWEAETLMTVTAEGWEVDWRGLAEAGLLKVWLWTASLRRGWRVEVDCWGGCCCCVCWRFVFDLDAGIYLLACVVGECWCL
jgi:hypothetical protein